MTWFFSRFTLRVLVRYNTVYLNYEINKDYKMMYKMATELDFFFFFLTTFIFTNNLTLANKTISRTTHSIVF